MAFSTCGVDNAFEHASGDGNAKSLPHVYSEVHWKRGTAIAAAVSSVAAENHGWEFAAHGVLFSIFGFVDRDFDSIGEEEVHRN